MSVFSFVVRKLNFLKSVPLFAQVFDSLIKIWILISNPVILDKLDEIEREVLTWERTTVSLHKYGGVQFNFDKKEFAHIHSNGILDILFTTTIKTELMAKTLAQEHHLFKKSGWITFYIKRDDDVSSAISLLRLSYNKVAAAASIRPANLKHFEHHSLSIHCRWFQPNAT